MIKTKLVVAALFAVVAMLPFLLFADGTNPTPSPTLVTYAGPLASSTAPTVLGFGTGDGTNNSHLKGGLGGEFNFTEIDAAAILTVNFDQYDAVYVTDDFINNATPAYAANLNSRQASISSYLTNGGCVVFGVQSFGGDSITNGDEYKFLPAGLVEGQTIGSQIFGDDVTITGSAHPIFAGVTDGDLSGWGSSFHGLFASGSLTTVAIGAGGESVIRVGSFNAGNIVGWTLDADFHGKGIQLLRNALNWCVGDRVQVGGATSFLTAESGISTGTMAIFASLTAFAFIMLVGTGWYARRRSQAGEQPVE